MFPIISSMSVIYILICISVLVAVIFLFLFIKSVKNGQFDDDYTPSVRMLFEDEVVKNSKTNKEVKQSNINNKNNSN